MEEIEEERGLFDRVGPLDDDHSVDLRIVDRERQHFGVVEDLEGFDQHFDPAGGNAGIIGARRTHPDDAGDFQDGLGVQMGGGLEDVLG